jgi:hypothetical protein
MALLIWTLTYAMARLEARWANWRLALVPSGLVGNRRTAVRALLFQTLL